MSLAFEIPAWIGIRGGHRVHNNNTILEEAARSIRRTFVGSLAGTIGMLTVVGAAGAYSVPDRLSPHSLSNAFATLQARLSPVIEQAAPLVERTRSFAGEVARRASAMPAPADAVVLPLAPEVVTPAVAAQQAVARTPAPEIAAPAAVAPPPAPMLALAPSDAAEPPVADNAMARATPAELPPPAPAPVEVLNEGGGPGIDAEVKIIALPTPRPSSARPAAVDAARPIAPAEQVEPAEDVPNALAEPKTVWVQLPRPKPEPSPAQRLNLHGAAYDKAERCLAQAVYFEARNQSLRGQMAVAQVVMNRVFSPYYPNDVCSVVYQNAHRRLSCQFTFACDGQSEAIRERGAWARAQRIARQTLDAQIWLPEVAKATHYHATYVRPYWVREMNVMVRFGLHTFYRPRNWGDGSNEPGWGAGAAPKKGRVL
jgi:spore germination cell wall hydrolase CwlJ-like protein